MSESKPWIVEVVRADTGEVINRIETTSEKKAERVERGVLINIHPECVTRIVRRDDDT